MLLNSIINPFFHFHFYQALCIYFLVKVYKQVELFLIKISNPTTPLSIHNCHVVLCFFTTFPEFEIHRLPLRCLNSVDKPL